MGVQIFRTGSDAVAAVTTPDQAGLIVGPGYAILDYANEGADLLFSAYGDADSASDGSSNGRPVTGSTVLSAEPPLLPVGALIDRSSIRLILTDILYEVATGVDGERNTENLFSTTDPNVDFGALGVRAGDRLVITDLGTEETVVTYILAVGGVGTAGAAFDSNELLVLDDFDTDLLSDGSIGEYAWRVEKALESAIIEGSVANLGGSGNTVILRGGLTLSLDPDGSGVNSDYPVSSAAVHIEYRALRRDLTALDTVSSIAEISSKIGPVDERNPLGLALYVALSNTTTEVQFIGIDGDDLNGATDREQAYLDALVVIENTDEVYAICPLTTNASTLASYVASVDALALPASSIFRLVVGGLDAIPSEALISDISATGDAEQVTADTVVVYAAPSRSFETAGVQAGDRLFIVTGSAGSTYDVESVLSEETLLLGSAGTAGAAARNFFVLAPNGDTWGIPQVAHGSNIRVAKSGGVDRVFVTNVRSLPAERIGSVLMLGEPSEDPAYFLVTAVTPAVAGTLELAGSTITLTSRMIGRAIMPDEPFEILVDTVDTGTLSVELDTDASPWRLTINYDDGVTLDTAIQAALNDDPVISRYLVASGGEASGTAMDADTDVPFTSGEYAYYTVIGPEALPGSEEDDWTAELRLVRTSTPVAESATFRKPFRRLYDANASFTTGAGAVSIGDLVQIPVDSEDTEYEGELWSGVVAEISSGQRLVLAAGSDFLLATPGTTSGTQDLATYRVVRALTAAGRVAELQARTEALDSANAVLVLPAQASISGASNGRLGSASRQPGTFLAAGVLGMIAGTPPHQGFSSRSIAGISQVYGLEAFTRAQVKTLADSGWMAWVQRTRTSPPICEHQSTTWQSSELAYRELSMIRAFHFAARAVKDAVTAFLGDYNVTTETLASVATVVRVTLEGLQSGRLPRIGAVLASASLLRVVANASQPDVIEIYIDWGFPAPLNQIDVYTRG